MDHTEEVRLPAKPQQPDQAASQHSLPNDGAGQNGDAQRPAKRARLDSGEHSSALEQQSPLEHAHEAHGGKNGALQQQQQQQQRLQRGLRLHGLRSLQLLDTLPGLLRRSHFTCTAEACCSTCHGAGILSHEGLAGHTDDLAFV